MFALLSLVVCLSRAPGVCETVIPDYIHSETGQPPSFFECLGIEGQDIAHRWLNEHQGFVLHRVQCSLANNERRLREQVEGPHA